MAPGCAEGPPPPSSAGWSRSWSTAGPRSSTPSWLTGARSGSRSTWTHRRSRHGFSTQTETPLVSTKNRWFRNRAELAGGDQAKSCLRTPDLVVAAEAVGQLPGGPKAGLGPLGSAPSRPRSPPAPAPDPPPGSTRPRLPRALADPPAQQVAHNLTTAGDGDTGHNYRVLD